mgnify:FL=1|tara:strand:+ start:975 stop:1844 length:870 start_codon:yes stop_codon:yes gene_type:complete
MGRCEFCSKEEDMPFVCNFCDETFCGEHRLPESHNCTNLWMVKERKRREIHNISSRPSLSSKFPRFIPKFTSTGINNRAITENKISTEVKHLLVAWLTLGFAFSIRFIRISPSTFPISLLEGLGVSLLTVGLGFILHELAHKFTAKRFGCWAEFRIWPRGLMMALFFAVVSFGTVIFAAPGATYILPRSSRNGFSNNVITSRENGIISLAGPLTNIGLAAFLFLPLAESGIGALSLIGVIGFHVNLWLAAFNLIPFGGIDGQKVLSWSKPVWLTIAIPVWLFVALGLLL